jgi:nitrogen fixation NifU-like protein
MYNEKVMKMFANPKNAGVVQNADGRGKVGNMRCGDIMQISIKVDKDIITDAKFKTFGCVSAIASSDMACEMIRGKSVEHAKKLTNRDILDALGGLPEQKVHCSVLGKEAIEAAIADYEKKQGKPKKH